MSLQAKIFFYNVFTTTKIVYLVCFSLLDTVEYSSRDIKYSLRCKRHCDYQFAKITIEISMVIQKIDLTNKQVSLPYNISTDIVIYIIYIVLD